MNFFSHHLPIQSKINIYYDKIMKHKEKKAYKKCMKLENKVIHLLSNQHTFDHQIYKIHGITLFHLKQYQKAITFLTKALNIEDDENSLYEVHYYLYLTYYEISDYDKLIEFGLKACESPFIELLEKAKIFSKIGRFYYLMNLSSNKMVYLIRGLYYNMESLKIFEKLNHTNIKEYIYTLFDCADINHALEDDDIAIHYYEKVEEMTDDDALLFGVYSSLIQIYKEKGYLDTQFFYKRKLLKLMT